MFKKGLVITIFIIIISFLNCLNISAARPKQNSYIQFEGKETVFIDQFCDPSTASCSNDGKTCFCKPSSLAYSKFNKKCEVAFGSKFYYNFKNNNTDKPQLILKGGLWSTLAKSYKEEANVTFKKVDDTENTFRSNFLQKLYNNFPELQKEFNIDNVSEFGIEVNADINPIFTIGKAYNQTFYTKLNNGQVHKCSINHQNGFLPEENNLKNFFFLKGSNFNFNPDKNKNKLGDNYCTAPAMTLMTLLFKNNNSPKYSATKNCTDRKRKEGFVNWLNNLSEESSSDLSLIASNLLIPYGNTRKIYFEKPDNFYFGQVFEKESKANRLEKIKKIEEFYKINCENKDKIECEQYSEKIIGILRKKPNKSFNQIVAELMTNAPAISCKIIDSSYDIPNLSNTINTINKKDEEKNLDKTISKGIVKICDQTFENNDKKRLKCKNNSQKCYLLNVDETKSVPSCEDLANNENLKNIKWMICPSFNTSLNTNQSLENFILKIFRTPISFTSDNSFKNTINDFIKISNIILILMFMVMIFSQLTNIGLNNYQIKKYLPRLIIMTILINLSYLINQILLDVSNIFGDMLIQTFDSINNNIHSSDQHIASMIFGSGLNIVLLVIMAIPFLIFSIIGLILGSLYLLVRKGLVVGLMLFTPVAFALSLSGATKKIFNKWWKLLIKVLLIFPIAVFLIKTGTLSKNIIYYVLEGKTNPGMTLLALFLPGISLLLLPALLKSISNGIINLSSINKFVSKNTKKAVGATYFVKSYKNNLNNFGRSLLFNKAKADNFFSNKRFNKLTNNYGRQIMSKQTRHKTRFVNDYNQIIQNEPQILKAFTKEGDNKKYLYQSLSNDQKIKYDNLLTLGAHKDPVFYMNGLDQMIENKTYDPDFVKELADKSIAKGVSPDELNNKLFVLGKISSKKGFVNIATSFNTTIDYVNKTSKGINSKNTIIPKGKNVDYLIDSLGNNVIKDIKNINSGKNPLDNNVKEFTDKHLPAVFDAINLLDKNYIETIQPENFDQTIEIKHLSDDGKTIISKEVSVSKLAIEYKLATPVNIDKSGDKLFEGHYLSTIANKWNFINPYVKENLKESILKTGERPDVANKRFTEPEQLFEYLGLESMESKI